MTWTQQMTPPRSFVQQPAENGATWSQLPDGTDFVSAAVNVPKSGPAQKRST